MATILNRSSGKIVPLVIRKQPLAIRVLIATDTISICDRNLMRPHWQQTLLPLRCFNSLAGEAVYSRGIDRYLAIKHSLINLVFRVVKVSPEIGFLRGRIVFVDL